MIIRHLVHMRAQMTKAQGLKLRAKVSISPTRKECGSKVRDCITINRKEYVVFDKKDARNTFGGKKWKSPQKKRGVGEGWKHF